MSPSSSDPLVGRNLAGCDISGLVGRGGMGSVYRARQVGLEREVAIKVLGSDLTSNAEFVRRFLLEARSAARITHPNVVTVYDAGRDGSHYYIIMEFVQGESLGRVINRRGALPVREVLWIARETLKGLSAAHTHGVIHRDVKPDNILLARPDGGQARRALVTDFGLARQMDTSKGLTRTGTIMGTPYYMAPEQADGRPVDARTDLYALGGTIYHALTGQVPFEGANSIDVIIRHRQDPVPDPRAIVAEIPDWLSVFVRRLLAKDPADRPKDAAAALRHLAGGISGRLPRQALRDPASPPATTGGTTADAPARAPWISRHRTIPVAGTLLLAVGFGALGVWLGRRSAPTAVPSPPAPTSTSPLAPAPPEGNGPEVLEPRAPLPEGTTPPSHEEAGTTPPIPVDDTSGTVPAPPPEDPEDALARAHEAAEANTHDPDLAIRLFREVAERHPKSRAARAATDAIRRIETRRECEVRLKELRESCETLAAEGRLREALVRWAEMPSELRALRSREQREAQAALFNAIGLAWFTEQKPRFHALVSEGELVAARALLEQVRALRLAPALAWAEARAEDLDRLESERRPAARYARLRENALDLARRRHYREASEVLLDFVTPLDDPPLAAEVTRDRDRLGLLERFWDGARRGADAVRSEYLAFTTRDGAMVAGVVLGLEGDEVRVDLGGEERLVPLRDLTPEGLAGLALRRLPTEEPAVQTALGLFFLLEERPEQAREALLAARNGGQAVDDLLHRLGVTPPPTPAPTTATPSSPDALLALFHAAREKTTEGRLDLVYDFAVRDQEKDWRAVDWPGIEPSGRWVINAGATGWGSRGLIHTARYTGDIEIYARVERVQSRRLEPPTVGLVLCHDGGASGYVVLVAGGLGHVVLLENGKRTGLFTERLKVGMRFPFDFHIVRHKEALVFQLNGQPFCQMTDRTHTGGHVGLWVDSPDRRTTGVRFTAASITGTLDPAWVEERLGGR